MAYVNVMEWKAENVAEWLQGLDDCVLSYAHFFINNNVTGKGLLNLTTDDLVKLHVQKIGHQETILEALELLKNLHYNLDTENLQYVSLKLSCKARSLCNELRINQPHQDTSQVVSTSMMISVGDVLDSLITLLSWLDRTPFGNQPHFKEFKNHLHLIGLELATNTQRDTFSYKPIDVIRDCCEKLAQFSDTLIQDCNDPLILIPAFLDVATLKKRRIEDDFGISFDPTYNNLHVVSNIRGSSLKIEPGDEIIQVNYQTVVGWNRKKVIRFMAENPFEVNLTLKKRPRHSIIGGHIKYFRLPARTQKKNSSYFNNLPSPRAELLVAPQIDAISSQNTVPSSHNSSIDDLADLTDIDSEDDEAFLPPPRSSLSSGSPTQSIRSVLLARPRSAPQRRATISGSSPNHHYLPYINISELQVWKDRKDADTLKSNDSGTSTMSADHRRRHLHPRTSSSLDCSGNECPGSPYMNVPPNSKIVSSEKNLDSGFSQTSDKPQPKPRRTSSSVSNGTTPSKKKPIPQPRSSIKSPQNVPVPTPQFKSYRKYPSSPVIQDVQPKSRLNSTPSNTPVTRLTKGASHVSHVTPPPTPKRSVTSSNMKSPYYMSDVYEEDRKTARRRSEPDMKPRPPPLPPLFKPGTYSIEEYENNKD